MSTDTAKELAKRYRKEALEQMAEHADFAAKYLLQTAQELKADGTKLSELKEYMDERDDFRQLAYYLRRVMQHLD